MQAVPQLLRSRDIDTRLLRSSPKKNILVDDDGFNSFRFPVRNFMDVSS